jgi:hypothetical protein
MLGTSVDLLAIDTSTPRPWTPGAKRIMRPGLRSIWFGSRGTGKSIAAMIVAVQVIEAGGSVVYLDWENGARRQAERLEAILLDRPASTRAAVAERLDYRPNPRLGKLASEQAVTEWASLFQGRDLALIDSTARALGQLGLDENSTPEFGRFMVAYIDPIAEQGAAVVLLDNTGWSEADRSRGASGKWDMVELVYKVTSTDFAPDRAGTLTLERARSRDGDEAGQLVAHVGDGCYSRVHQPGPDERQAALLEALIEYVRDHPGASTEAVAKDLHLRPSRVRDGLALLEGSGTVVIRSQTTDRRGRTHTRKGWYLPSDGHLTAVPLPGTGTDVVGAGANGRPAVPLPIEGRGQAPSDVERAEALAERARRAGAA